MESYHRLYEITLPLVGVQNLVMGVTLSVLCLAKKYGRLHNRSGLIFLAIAMWVLAIINLAEYTAGIHEGMEKRSLAVVTLAASIEMFLCFFTYVSLLDKSFVTRKRIIGELALILLFTAPPLFVQQTEFVSYRILFSIALGFYAVKLALNFFLYRRYLRRAMARIEDFHSAESSSLLAWINRTFYATMAVGVVSVIAPMGDFRTLIGYNLFTFLAFFYIYIEVIRNIYVFDGSMAVIEQHSPETGEDKLEKTAATEPQEMDDEVVKHAPDSFMTPHRQILYQHWIARKGYTDPCVTADNIALILNTNRNRLSIYLNNELGMNYYEWIAHLRIEDAKRLLVEEPETPICNIAIRVGIEDKSNFGRAFRRVTGMSPTRYRNDHLAV